MTVCLTCLENTRNLMSGSKIPYIRCQVHNPKTGRIDDQTTTTAHVPRPSPLPPARSPTMTQNGSLDLNLLPEEIARRVLDVLTHHHCGVMYVRSGEPLSALALTTILREIGREVTDLVADQVGN